MNIKNIFHIKFISERRTSEIVHTEQIEDIVFLIKLKGATNLVLRKIEKHKEHEDVKRLKYYFQELQTTIKTLKSIKHK